MSFWNLAKLEPTRKFRFQVSSPNALNEASFWIHAKSIDKPSYDMNVGEYQIGNYKLKYPGVVSWSDVNITVVDTGGKVERLMDNLKQMGWDVPGSSNGIEKGEKPGQGACLILIDQLDASGTAIEKWQLHNSFFKSINFGQLSYSDDELVEIQITVTFDYATFEKGKKDFGT